MIPLGGKNAQQIQGAVQKQIKTYQKLMEAFTKTARAEQALINHVQARAWVANLLHAGHAPCCAVSAFFAFALRYAGGSSSSSVVLQ